MTPVIRVLRGYYVPQFVLGGLTRAIGPVILRNTAKTIPATATAFFGQGNSGSSSPFPPYAGTHALATSPTVIMEPPKSIYSATPNQAAVCFPLLAIQAACPLDSASLVPTESVATIFASSGILPSPMMTLDSSFSFSVMVFRLLVVGLFLAVWAVAYRPERFRSKNLAQTPLSVTPSLPYQWCPSDSPNWRAAQHDSVHDDTIHHPTVTLRPNPEPVLPPAISSELPRGYIPVRVTAFCQATASATKSGTMLATPPATPGYATYVPPHMRGIYNTPSARRPLAEVANGISGERTKAPSQTTTQALRRRRRSAGQQSPFQSQGLPSHPLRHRASYPVDVSLDIVGKHHITRRTESQPARKAQLGVDGIKRVSTLSCAGLWSA
ncbi:hypothetical protein B0H10DRAFT_1945440 [Mycena sp. CBHHK59/15]|nr:hypothetical protein B0H10DRAFT_1945440 [Mycena sp. CBHHK59/15]